MEEESHAAYQAVRVDPRACRAAEVSEPRVRLSPSNVSMRLSPMMVSSLTSLRFGKQDQTHEQRFLLPLFPSSAFRFCVLVLVSFPCLLSHVFGVGFNVFDVDSEFLRDFHAEVICQVGSR